MAIAEKITTINNAINDIKENLGVSESASLETLVTQSQSAVVPTGSINITENGTYDVSNKSSAVVNVSGGGGDLSEYFESEVTDVPVPTAELDGMQFVKKIPAINISNTVTNLAYAFSKINVDVSIGTADTSNVTSTYYMFSNSNCLNENSGFEKCSFLNVANFERTFNHATIGDNTNLSKFYSTTEAGSNCTGMFSYATFEGNVVLPIFRNVKTATTLFQYANQEDSSKQIVINLGNLQKYTALGNLFYNSYLTNIKVMSTNKPLATSTNVNGFFYGCTLLETLDISEMDMTFITANASSKGLTNWFTNCSSLKNLKFGTNLGNGYGTSLSENNTNASLNLSKATSLTYESIMSVINNLYDLTSNGKKNQQLIISSDTNSLLSDNDRLIATSKGWNINVV